MLELRIHGRGGQGGVTLAKLIATSRFLKGASVQAFGLYAAERSGAPIQAFCRFSDDPITVRNLIYEPDHVIVLDPTLVELGIDTGLKPGGWFLLNTPDAPETFAERFPGHPVACVDATGIARAHELGSRSVPIVNTALAGAVTRILEFPLDEMIAAMEHMGFIGANIEAARAAHDSVRLAGGRGAPPAPGDVRPGPTDRGPSFVEGAGGSLPGIRTGQWATEQPRRTQYVPPCNHVCPAGNDVQAFLHALAKDRVDEGLEILLRTSPFPSVCGRVCPAPCMASCNRIALDGAVNVRDLERYAGDHGAVELQPAPDRPERIAIVGSGPAGVTAAYHLALRGYSVVVFEAGAEIGGLLRTGIPDFRLPGDALTRELERISDLGVEWVTDSPVSRDRLLDLSRSYDAVVVATGLQEMRSLALGVGGTDVVMQGIDFLDRVKHGAIRVDGEDLIVVGGGNTALDAARSALRLGARSVRVVYRRTRQEMPAIEEEVEEGLEEGVTIDFLVQPVALEPVAQADGGGSAHGLRCRRMELGEPDASGRRRPVPIPESDLDLPCDRVILAMGQSPDLSIFPEGTEVREGDDLLGILERPVFAVGDLATREGTVAGAIGSGRRAALHVHQTLTGTVEDSGPASRVRSDVDEWRDEVIRSEALRMHLFERLPRHDGPELPPAERLTSFDEIHSGLGDAAEARRCLSCGVCNECDLCITYCPEGVLKRVGHELVFDYAYCKGCGICVTECPRNVVFMSHL